MNEFVQSKLGEVLAFARVGKDTLQKGNKAIVELLGDDQAKTLSSELDELEKGLTEYIQKENVQEEVEKDASETFAKVITMRDTYLAGEWDETSEVLEWMGFYSGASLVHWYLVNGAAESLGLADVKDTSDKAIKWYSSLFSSDEKFLQDLGKKHASA